MREGTKGLRDDGTSDQATKLPSDHATKGSEETRPVWGWRRIIAVWLSEAQFAAEKWSAGEHLIAKGSEIPSKPPLWKRGGHGTRLGVTLAEATPTRPKSL
jgi:hypothetical protein